MEDEDSGTHGEGSESGKPQDSTLLTSLGTSLCFHAPAWTDPIIGSDEGGYPGSSLPAQPASGDLIRPGWLRRPRPPHHPRAFFCLVRPGHRLSRQPSLRPQSSEQGPQRLPASFSNTVAPAGRDFSSLQQVGTGAEPGQLQ